MESIKVSPTQVGKFRSCPRLIGFEYVEDQHAPSTVKQEFGSEVHRQLERWLKHGIAPDDLPAGQVAKQGIRTGWLPTPGKHLLVEHEILYQAEPWISLGGYIDCIEPPTEDTPPLVIDHKTTSDLRWAKSPDQLAYDPQALIYSAWAMLRFIAPRVVVRWMYYAASNPSDGSPRKPTGAKPVQLEFEANDSSFLQNFSVLLDDVRKVVEIRRKKISGLALPPNPLSCEKFGGCFHKDKCNLTPGDHLAAYMERGTIV